MGTIELQNERFDLSCRVQAMRLTLEKSAGYMSDEKIAAYKTVISDCERRIDEIDETLNIQ